VDALRQWTESLPGQSWVAGASVDGSTARIVVKDPLLAKRELLGSAVRAGLALDRYEEIRPSLEDVFLQLVGEEGLQ
jgi:hypothetical protein